MSAAHTPTPWLASGDKVYIAATMGRSIIANCDLPKNAAFIVCACNAHDELVAALRVALKHVERADADSGCIAYMNDAQQVRAALAKVAAP